MKSIQERSVAQRIFENILFIEEIFAERDEGEVPDVHFLELARSFEVRRRDRQLSAAVREVA
jgi:hypothetical protein